MADIAENSYLDLDSEMIMKSNFSVYALSSTSLFIHWLDTALLE